MLDYKKLGLKCGIEIHQQLDTKHKLFCDCLSRLSNNKTILDIKRKLRAVAGELGQIDAAALHEVSSAKEFYYKFYPEETCLVETDSEPPHCLNKKALTITIEIALLLNCEIPDEIHVMRKTVIDGSNTAGFQRTAIIGLNGWIETSFGKVGITNVCIEEDAAQILEKRKNSISYGLDRLGIPLVEIGTDCNIPNPDQAREVAKKIGMILRSTKKVKRGLGTIRQDLNVSIKGGARTEVKGVQNLNLIPKIVENEIIRQKDLISKKKKIKEEVRKALPNGKTQFLRPLPGAARMYPETDVKPIRIEMNQLQKIKKQLPELIEETVRKLAKKYKINEELAKQIVDSGRTMIFEELADQYNKLIVANTLTSYMKQLKTEGIPVENIKDDILKKLFKGLKKNIAKEALLNILKQIAKNPKEDVSVFLKDIETVSDDDLRKIIKNIINKHKDLLKKDRPEKVFMGLVMKEVRGKVPGDLVMKILTEELKHKS